jgi:methylthioribose-1-phosphate isomerase
MIRTIAWEKGRVVMIDQRKLPAKETYVSCRNYRQVIRAIRTMVIRGAPAIGIAAAMGAALGALGIRARSREAFLAAFDRICSEIGSARPTAVNLTWALERMRKRAVGETRASVQGLKKALVREAREILAEDVRLNRLIGLHGEAVIPKKASVLTHCNAGALATGGYGTALGVIRAAVAKGKKVRVLVDETRPFLQGARLTAWELVKERIPAFLITDNMAGYFMKKGEVDLVIVGADRIAANGDTANKIGTYTLAVLAREHGIPFYVAAPLSTVDFSVADGGGIPIEEREEKEVTHLAGKRIAAEGIRAFNPAFDVTPAPLITGIITEKGIGRPPLRRSLKKLAAIR